MNIHLNSHGEGTPLVFFHGWGFDQGIWASILPKLSAMYRVILIDLPGFGFTPVMEWPEFKAQLLQQLPEKMALVGWSLGGLYATRLAIEEPLRVSHLFNVCSSPRFIVDTCWPGVSLNVFERFYKRLSQNLEATLAEFVALQVNDKSIHIEPSNHVSYQGLKTGLNILETWDLREPLKHLNIQVCYLFGRLDPITSVKIMERMQLLYPSFSYILFRKSAHMPFLSHPQEFVKELMEFIQ